MNFPGDGKLEIGNWKLEISWDLLQQLGGASREPVYLHNAEHGVGAIAGRIFRDV